MSEPEVSGHGLARSKEALLKTRRAESVARAAGAARDSAQRRRELDTFMSVFVDSQLSKELAEAQKKGYTERVEALQRRIEERGQEREALQEEYRRAYTEEQEALEKLAEAQEELDEATVEPRVEGLKLRFETRKLQATLSAGIVVGVATITEVLLPPKPNYTWMLWITYASFFVSLYGALSDMQKLSFLAENIRISGTSGSEKSQREKWARRARQGALKGFFVGVVLFAAFVTLNLA